MYNLCKFLEEEVDKVMAMRYNCASKQGITAPFFTIESMVIEAYSMGEFPWEALLYIYETD